VPGVAPAKRRGTPVWGCRQPRDPGRLALLARAVLDPPVVWVPSYSYTDTSWEASLLYDAQLGNEVSAAQASPQQPWAGVVDGGGATGVVPMGFAIRFNNGSAVSPPATAFTVAVRCATGGLIGQCGVGPTFQLVCCASAPCLTRLAPLVHAIARARLGLCSIRCN
jgi:hypothetical protein